MSPKAAALYFAGQHDERPIVFELDGQRDSFHQQTDDSTVESARLETGSPVSSSE